MIHEVPVHVIIDGQTFHEGLDISTTHVTEALRAGQTVTTSRPSVNQFVELYERLASDGATGIVSTHLSSELSGTYESALLASNKMDVPVRVIDSRQVGMAMGFPIMRAAERASDDLDAMEAMVREQCVVSSLTFYVDTLEFLQRGGRISSLQSRIGSALNVKPILQMQDGRIESTDKVRTSSKGIAQLVSIATKKTTAKKATIPSDIAVHHVQAHDRADELAYQLRSAIGIDDIPITECGPVIGAHVGPGAVAVVVSPRP